MNGYDHTWEFYDVVVGLWFSVWVTISIVESLSIFFSFSTSGQMSRALVPNYILSTSLVLVVIIDCGLFFFQTDGCYSLIFGGWVSVMRVTKRSQRRYMGLGSIYVAMQIKTKYIHEH